MQGRLGRPPGSPSEGEVGRRASAGGERARAPCSLVLSRLLLPQGSGSGQASISPSLLELSRMFSSLPMTKLPLRPPCPIETRL